MVKKNLKREWTEGQIAWMLEKREKGFSYREIASEFGCGPSTIHAKCKRAKEQIAAAVENTADMSTHIAALTSAFTNLVNFAQQLGAEEEILKSQLAAAVSENEALKSRLAAVEAAIRN